MLQLSHRVTTLAVAAVSLLALGACSDNASVTRPIQSTAPSLGKTVTGSTSRLIYAHHNLSDFDLVTINPDGSDPKLATDYHGDDLFGVLSPDGKRFAFMSTRDNPMGDLYIGNFDNYDVVRLTYGPGASQNPSWSKDGKQLVFSSTRDAADPLHPTDNDVELYIINVDGSGLVRLTNDKFSEFDPAWSPDGRQIAFVSDRDRPAGDYTTDLYVMNVDGTQVTRLTAQPGLLTYPSWDSHSRRIAFSVDEQSANTGIYVLDVVSRGLTRLTFGGPYLDAYPSWSPDANKLAFQSKRDGVAEIYTMNADGTGQTRITTTGGGFPRWSR